MTAVGQTKSGNNVTSTDRGSKELSILGGNILKFISTGANTPESLVKNTGVDKSIVMDEIVDLLANGYITKDRFLTKKGYEYLQNKG